MTRLAFGLVIAAAGLTASACTGHATQSVPPSITATGAVAPTSATPLTYGVQPEVLAQRLGLTGAHRDPASTSIDPRFPALGVLIGQRGGQTIVVATFNTPADEATAAVTVQAGGSFIPGLHWYAGGRGWLAYSTAFDKGSAQDLASKLGGSMKRLR